MKVAVTVSLSACRRLEVIARAVPTHAHRHHVHVAVELVAWRRESDSQPETSQPAGVDDLRVGVKSNEEREGLGVGFSGAELRTVVPPTPVERIPLLPLVGYCWVLPRHRARGAAGSGLLIRRLEE